MKSMTKAELKKLENIQQNIQITLYLPLLPGPENTAKNVSMLHHAVALLHKTYTNVGISRSNQNLIQEHVSKLEQELHRPQSSKSLAIFITDSNQMMAYALDFSVETAIYFMVPHMQLEPLRTHYRDATSYWVLSLSQKGCKLFRGIGDTVYQVAARDLSLDLKSMLRLDETSSSKVQSHSIGDGSKSVNESYHGQGGFRDVKKRYLEKYFRVIDKKLHSYIGNDNSPLYVVGVDYSKALFKRISKHKNIVVAGGLSTNLVAGSAIRDGLKNKTATLVTA